MESLYDPITNSFRSMIPNVPLLYQIMWHITSKCELNCRFCFNDKRYTNGGAFDNNQLDKIENAVSIMKALGVEKVDISGGEPLLVQCLPSIVEICTNAGFFLTITTSGCGRTDNLKWLCNNHAMFSRIILSLDGLELEHNYLRQHSEAYSKVTSYINQLIRSNCNAVRINTVVTNRILEGEYPALLINKVMELYPLEWCIIQPHEGNKKDSFDDVNITDAEFSSFVDVCKKYATNRRTKVLVRPNSMYSAYWTLNPGGVLVYGDTLNESNFLFDEQNLGAIRDAIKQNTIILPKEN